MNDENITKVNNSSEDEKKAHLGRSGSLCKKTGMLMSVRQSKNTLTQVVCFIIYQKKGKNAGKGESVDYTDSENLKTPIGS